MGVAIVIAGGLVLMTLVASLFSYLGEKKKRLDPQIEEKINRMERRLTAMEAKAAEKDERIDQLESEISFVNKLIEQRPK